MKKMNWKQFSTWLAVFLLVVSAIIPMSASAKGITENVDSTRTDGTITVKYERDGVEFSLYKIASMDDYTHFTATGEFSSLLEKLNVTESDLNDLESTTGDGLASEAETLANNLKNLINGGAEVTAEKATSKGREANFSGLSTGMYLLIKAEDKVKNEDNTTTIYSQTAQIISLPRQNLEDNRTEDWNYNLTVTVKDITSENVVTSIIIKKQWDYDAADDKEAAQKKYPKKEVTVKLLVGDEVYDGDTKHDYSNLKLNEENDWTIILTDLKIPDGTWTVEEVTKLDNFKVSIMERTKKVGDKTVKKGVIVTNTFEPPTTPPNDTPDKKTTEVKKVTTKKTLPKTGQLWWPVPVLAIIGMAAFLVGSIKNRRYHKDNEE